MGFALLFSPLTYAWIFKVVLFIWTGMTWV